MNKTMTRLPSGAVRLHGPLGKALDTIVKNRLKKINYTQLVDPFRYRDEDDGGWRCEFWGKNVRAAIFAQRSVHDPELGEILRATVNDMISTQTADGRISSYPQHRQLSGWDIWGRKYVLVAMLEYYRELKPTPKLRDSIIRMTDDILTTAGRIENHGEHYGMAASSILRALLGVYEISGDKRHLDAAEKLINVGCCHVHNVFNALRIGALPSEISNAKAYEMTSCFQGAAAYCESYPRKDLSDALFQYYKSVRDHEILITGTGGLKDGSGEFWYGGRERQVRKDCGGTGETCITVTWLAYCEQMLRLFGEAEVVDEMERSLYNALLGALVPEGDNFIHINPYLTGDRRRASRDQMSIFAGKPFHGHDCCRAQGPYGFGIAPLVAVMRTENGFAVNLYEDMKVDGILRVEGGYPAHDKVRIIVEREGSFELSLRIPSGFACRVDGQARSAGYAALSRNWKTGDIVELEFDLMQREIHSQCGMFNAYMSGPLVLAEDKRPDNAVVNPLRRVGGMIDYATAGNMFSDENTLRVWSPAGN